jgi:hypothetical protein
MPVLKGKSKKVIKQNIQELKTGNTHARTQAKKGKKQADKQSIAIALDTARKSGARIPRSASSRRGATR